MGSVIDRIEDYLVPNGGEGGLTVGENQKNIEKIALLNDLKAQVKNLQARLELNASNRASLANKMSENDAFTRAPAFGCKLLSHELKVAQAELKFFQSECVYLRKLMKSESEKKESVQAMFENEMKAHTNFVCALSKRAAVVSAKGATAALDDAPPPPPVFFLPEEGDAGYIETEAKRGADRVSAIRDLVHHPGHIHPDRIYDADDEQPAGGEEGALQGADTLSSAHLMGGVAKLDGEIQKMMGAAEQLAGQISKINDATVQLLYHSDGEETPDFRVNCFKTAKIGRLVERLGWFLGPISPDIF